jgi:sporulation protein YlmC with PRC-barrel domain
MLTSVSHLKGLAIHASDGEIGHVDEFYFDDESWAIRYLVVNTGSWLSGRLVLISPAFLRGADLQARQLHLALTRRQIEDSPGIDTHKSVSRQYEAEYMNYYGSSYYWGGSYLWGAGPMPSDMFRTAPPSEIQAGAVQRNSAGFHLRSTSAVTGYSIAAEDASIGHVKDFIINSDTWRIHYLEIDTHKLIPGKTVLLAPEWVQSVNWSDSEIRVRLSSEMIKSAPEYRDSVPITREYEDEIHRHYGKVPYWHHETEHLWRMKAGN